MAPAAEAVPTEAGEELQGVEEASISATGPRKWLALGFSLVGFIVVIFASLSTRVIAIPHSAQFGLLQLLPWTYWAGLGLMGFAMGIAASVRSTGMVAVTGVGFFAVFSGTPILFEVNPPVWDAYIHLGLAQDIGFFGRLPTDLYAYSRNWPGSFVFVAILGLVGSLGPVDLLSLFPFLTGALTFLGLLIFFRSLLPAGPAIGGAILGSFLNAWAQFHLSPQSLGLFLALLVLATVWERRIALRTASAVLFVGLVVTHPTSTVLILGIFVVDAAMTYLRRPKKAGERTPGAIEERFAHSPALTLGILWVAWLFFQATASAQVAQTAIITQIASILQVPERTISLATSRAVENVYPYAPLLRLGALVIFGLIGLVALVRLSRGPETRRVSQFFWAAYLSLPAFALADIFAFRGLFVDRSLMLFALFVPAVALAGITASRMRRSAKNAFVALLVLTSLASASTFYYQEAFYFVTARSVAVSEHLQDVAQPALVLDGQYPEAVWLSPDQQTIWDRRPFYSLYPEPFENLTEDGRAIYAVFDTEWSLWYRQWYGIDIFEFYEADRQDYALIYSNGQFDIYFISPPDSPGS